MKYFLTILMCLSVITCQKEMPKPPTDIIEESAVAPYDTIAVDSFSVGATSVDIALKIKMASKHYQDSLKKIKEKLEEENLLKKAKEDQRKAEEKKKAEKDIKNDKTQSSSESKEENKVTT